jgi:hypothetical protein
MGKNIPAGSIPRRSVLPPGNHTLEIEKLEETDLDGSYALRGAYRSLGPVAGLTHSELFVIGTEADPTAEDPDSWTGPDAWSAQRLFRMLDKAKVPGAEAESVDSEQLCIDAEGHRFDVVCTHVIDDGKRNPANKGKTYVRLAYFEEGSLQAGAAPARGSAPRPTPAAPARPTPPARPPAPVRQATPAAPQPNGEDTEYEAPAAAAAAPAPPPARGTAPQRPIPRRTA